MPQFSSKLLVYKAPTMANGRYMQKAKDPLFVTARTALSQRIHVIGQTFGIHFECWSYNSCVDGPLSNLSFRKFCTQRLMKHAATHMYIAGLSSMPRCRRALGSLSEHVYVRISARCTADPIADDVRTCADACMAAQTALATYLKRAVYCMVTLFSSY
jgi:hypothetical protein